MTLALVATSCAKTIPPFTPLAAPIAAFRGPDTVDLDLIRPGMGASRVYVYATLPDGEPGLFQIDTGASISVLSTTTADRLGVPVEETGGFVEGLSGRSPLFSTTLSEIGLGEAVVPEVEFAVGVPGVGERAGAMVLDGILGNNVWSRFVVDIDYPADHLALHRPGTFRMPRTSTPMFFDGNHVLAPIDIVSDSEPSITSNVFVQVDTGAGELWLIGDTGRAFANAATEGIEPVYGIGASEVLPPTQYLQRTRRIPLQSVGIGGRRIHVDFDAAWLGFEPNTYAGPSTIKGLAGHELLANYRAIFAYSEGLFALRRSPRRRARLLDGHTIALRMDIDRFGADAPERAVYRAELHAALGERDAAEALLVAFLDDQAAMSTTEGEARVLLAAIRRANGNLTGASQALAPLSPAELIEYDQIVSTVNGLLLDGFADGALALAESAVAVRPDDGSAQIALADALVGMQRYPEAEAALLTAAALASNPDAHMVRRARIRLAAGDRIGAMALLRRMIELYPTDGLFVWFYTLLLDGPDDILESTLRQDIEDAMSRLHPQQQPFDFLVASHTVLGNQEEAARFMDRGIARDCAPQTLPSAQGNCMAWYWSLAKVSPDTSLQRVDEALQASGPRSDYLDTKAMVHLARGEYDLARDAAVKAARLAPDDIYMLWQAERLASLSETKNAARE
ncbi:MAG: tetratricopeptide (TPR) repeat protein [bacterium]|jgi:tetratricopeptide (TPR) repeat protein